MVGFGLFSDLGINGANVEISIKRLQTEAELDPDEPGILLDVSLLYQMSLRSSEEEVWQNRALKLQRAFRLSGTKGAPQNPRLRVLSLVTSGDYLRNIPLEFILDNTDVELNLLYLLPGMSFPEVMPDHDVAILSISESDKNIEILQRLSPLLPSWPRPVMNSSPSKIMQLSRNGTFALLKGISGLVTAPVQQVTRQMLVDLGEGHIEISTAFPGMNWPILVRPLGTHGGRGCEKVDDSLTLNSYLNTHASPQFYVTSFIDYRSKDGQHRKYRIVFIEGRPFICHLGISKDWLVTYFKSGMSLSPAKRSEEARVMKTFDQDFAIRHQQALSDLHTQVGLDYYGVDCSETPTGELLVFEIDVAMLIHAHDPIEIYPYKQIQMRKIFEAFHRMLDRFAGLIPHHTLPHSELSKSEKSETSLDPRDWKKFRSIAHQVLDASLDHIESAREGSVWKPVSNELQSAMERPLPWEGVPTEKVLQELIDLVLPNRLGNTHPRFFGWAHGAGTAGGALAELVAATLNANVGGRDHGAVRIERQVLRWTREIMGFPEGSSGLLVTGTSMANLIGFLIARTAILGVETRTEGVIAAMNIRFPHSKGLTAYASSGVHVSVKKAMETVGMGSLSLRLLPADLNHQLPPAVLEEAIAADRAAGFVPFLIVGTAGSVDVGAIDDLAAIGEIARREKIWFHVDGAFGALAILSPLHRPALAGIESADSLAFDFHKWAHVPYDAGCILVRDEKIHRATFAMEPSYLTRAERGTAGGSPWFCDYGPELSRGARAIKIWTTLTEQGLTRIAQAIEANCRAAAALATRIKEEPELELLAPVPLNIVCFRHRPTGLEETALDHHNLELACDLQESGTAVLSTTRINGKLALRAAILNHRTTEVDIQIMLDKVLSIGRGYYKLRVEN